MLNHEDGYVASPLQRNLPCETLQQQMKKARRSKGRFAKPPVYGS